MLKEGIREQIIGTIFECTDPEHHQIIATFRSRRTFFRYTVLDTLWSVLYRVSSTVYLKKVLRGRNVDDVLCTQKIVSNICSRIPSFNITTQSLVERFKIQITINSHLCMSGTQKHLLPSQQNLTVLCRVP